MEYVSQTNPQQEKELQDVLHLAHVCNYEPEQAHHVAQLSLRLFDELQSVHQLDAEARRWLHYAALLHDIGLIEGWKGHHKATLKIIQNTVILSFDDRERQIIGSIARYHRKSLPDIEDDHFAALTPKDRSTVSTLAAFLRLAVDLNTQYHQRIRNLKCKIKKNKIIITCDMAPPYPEDEEIIADRCDLLEKVYNRKLIIRWKQTS